MTLGSSVVVIDNGSWSLKAGLASDATPRLIPNFIAKAKHERKRVFVGAELGECSDKSGLFIQSPFERGFLLRWEMEHQIWDRLFAPAEGALCAAAAADTTLVCTEPPLNFPSCQETLNEVVFEDYGLGAALRTTAASLAARRFRHEHPEALGVTVVDSGYSASHIVPHAEDNPIRDAIIRINIGGKILTNHLKEMVSYRQMHVMEEFYTMNQCKEDVCFVSDDFRRDMGLAKSRGSALAREYVLPDFRAVLRGVVRLPGAAAEEEQCLRLSSERFAVPELLFQPSDVGIEDMGLAEAAHLAIAERAPPQLGSHLARNVLAIGGNAAFPGFKERLYAELRSRLPDIWDLGLTCEEPETYAWQGGALLGRQPDVLKELVVTRAEYLEHGHSICIKKFRI